MNTAAVAPKIVAMLRVSQSQTGMELGALLMQALPRDFPSRPGLRKVLGRGLVTVDGVKCRDQLKLVLLGQEVRYMLPPEKSSRHYQASLHATAVAASDPQQPGLELEFAHIDDWFAACIKPPGIAVQGDKNEGADKTSRELNLALAAALPPPYSRPDALSVPRAVHRLDRATGGLLLLARTAATATTLSTAFATSGSIRKTYMAIVAGKLEGRGCVDTPLDGKVAKTLFFAVAHFRSAESGWVTVVQLNPVTGRTHQLRRHMAMLRCPILGDTRYNSIDSRAHAKCQSRILSLYLWAKSISLSHPFSGEQLTISAPLPRRFAARANSEEADAAALLPDAWEAVAAQAAARMKSAAARRERDMHIEAQNRQALVAAGTAKDGEEGDEEEGDEAKVRERRVQEEEVALEFARLLQEDEIERGNVQGTSSVVEATSPKHDE